MTPRRPFLIVSDGPQEPTGLGRIARDLTGYLIRDFGGHLDVLQVGGAYPPIWGAWPHVPMGETERGDDWGAAYVAEVYRSAFGDEPGVLWGIWDPARLYPYTRVEMPVQRWGYFAVDGETTRGGLSGAAGAAVTGFDRALAYGRWGASVLRAHRKDAVTYLPHGFHATVYEQPETDTEAAWVRTILGPTYKGQTVVGVVATNQPRKDWGLALLALAELRRRGIPVFGWLHTDVLVKAWSLPTLVEDLGLQEVVRITGFQDPWTDRQLALLYRRCGVTIAPGLAEGFGYPIVESLASGVPVVHVDHGGGRELVPRKEWRFPVRETRLESIYGLRRPVARSEDVANAVGRALEWREKLGGAASEYCRGAVEHLRWERLWPRWAQWVRKGVEV